MVNGDESSFCELYALYKGRLIYFALQFAKSLEFAEDVFQDAFASVWENRRFVNPHQPFTPYIDTIIKLKIIVRVVKYISNKIKLEVPLRISQKDYKPQAFIFRKSRKRIEILYELSDGWGDISI